MSTNHSPKYLVFMGATPSGAENIGVKPEAKLIEKVLGSPSTQVTAFPLTMATPVLLAQNDELQEVFAKNPPYVLHISAHGTPQGDLVIHDRRGNAAELTTDGLGALLGAAGAHPKLIVLNACSSESFAKDILDFADCVIGTTDELPTDVAMKFSETFYTHLGPEGIPCALEKALADIKAIHPASDELYVIYSGSVLTTDAYVIQPLDSPGSPKRERAENVFIRFINPACRKLKFNPRRIDAFAPRRASEPIVTSLRSSRLVLADLGSPPWDPDVMTEVGFRLASGRPIVFLAEPDVGLPALVETQKTFRLNEPLKHLVDLCKTALQQPEAWESNYPTVEIAVDRRIDTAEYVYANDSAAQLYNVRSGDDLIGKLVKDVDEGVYEWMPEVHRNAFVAEQSELLPKCLVPNATADVRATIPMWFTTHPKKAMNGTFFWPILSQKSHAPLGRASVLRIVFVPVTDWMSAELDDIPSAPKRLPIDCLRYESLSTDVLCIHCMRDSNCDVLRFVVDGALGPCGLRFKPYEVYDRCDDLPQLARHSKLLLLCLSSNTPSTVLQEALERVLTQNRNKPVAIMHTSDLDDPLGVLEPNLQKILKEAHCPTFSVDLNNVASPTEKARREKLRSVIYCMKALLRQEILERGN